MQLFIKILLRLALLLFVCVIGGVVNIVAGKFLGATNTDHTFNPSNLSDNIFFTGRYIVIIYAGWSIGLALINYLFHQRISMSVHRAFKISLTIISFIITMSVFTILAGGTGSMPVFIKLLIVVLISSLIMTILEHKIRL